MSTDTSQELAKREPTLAPPPAMTDAEIASHFRIAKALAESGLYKDAKTAGQAFAKIIVGRDLGLSPAEAMSELHVIEGKVEAGANLHASRVKAHPDYDYVIEELTNERCRLLFRRHSTEDEFVSEFRMEDAKAAKLIRAGSPWEKFPRNMLFARAVSNGVAWFCPDVMGGMRVYTHGEIEAAVEDLTAGNYDAGPEESVQLPTEVEAILARARELGHAGIADRAAAVASLKGQSPEYVGQWCRTQTRTLNNLATAKGAEVEPLPEPPETVSALRVEGEEACGVEAPGAIKATCELPRGHSGMHLGGGLQWDVFLEPDEKPEGENLPSEPAADPADLTADELAIEALQAMRNRLERLEQDAEEAQADGNHEKAEALNAEAEAVRSSIAAASDDDQGALL
jgi:hypothetical protein